MGGGFDEKPEGRWVVKVVGCGSDPTYACSLRCAAADQPAGSFALKADIDGRFAVSRKETIRGEEGCASTARK